MSILHDTSVDYYGIFDKASAADDINMVVVDVSLDPADGQWDILVRSDDLDVSRARRRWETAIEKRRMEKS